MQCKVLWHAVIVILAMSTSSALAAPKCPINYGAQADAKPNKLYLFFPATEVPTGVNPLVFPPTGFDHGDTAWLPLKTFKLSDLPGYTGTVDELKDAIYDAVADIYCEFNVQVIPIIDPLPLPTGTERRNVVGIGSDQAANRDCQHHGPLYGQATAAGGDPGDSNPRDFARIWAGAFNCAYPPFLPAGWANAIGSSAAHEAAHNYGLSHADGEEIKRPNEDDWMHHLMQAGTGSYSDDHRAHRRHFSDFETSLLARNVGLAIDTMWTWELVNPNTESAAKLRMELLSTEPTAPILSWAFGKETSPWINPTLTGPDAGARAYKGKNYFVYHIEWSVGNEHWSPFGQVPPGKNFQVGATFSRPSLTDPDPEAIIISDVRLFNAADQALPKRPHWMGFDAGTFDNRTGDLNVRFFNPLDRPLILRDVVVRDMPRVMSINAMLRNNITSDIFGREFAAWGRWGTRRPLLQPVIGNISNLGMIEPGGELKVPVANLGQGHHVSVQRSDSVCAKHNSEHGLLCHAGITADDLFPATTMYITATIVDPVTVTVSNPDGIESYLFYQIAGRRARLPSMIPH